MIEDSLTFTVGLLNSLKKSIPYVDQVVSAMDIVPRDM
jgi:hypothetical protein